jgi:tetratricopeptide (TPR) repeat protein
MRTLPKPFLLIASQLTLLFVASAQLPLEKQLAEKARLAPDYKSRVAALGQLAEFYTVYRADRKADSVLEVQLSVAELSGDQSLITEALFGNSFNTLSSWSGTETFEKTLSLIQKGLDHAKSVGQKELEAVAYLRKANLYRKRKLYDQASQHVLLAFPVLDNSNDSLKTELFLELGEILLAKGDIAAAYSNFNKAFDLAYSKKNTALLSSTYHHFSNLYTSLGNTELAKSNLLESVRLNTEKANAEGLLVDYINLFRMTANREFLDKASRIADSVKSVRYQLFAKRLAFHALSIKEKNPRAALAYLNQHPDLYQSFVYQGMLNYYIGTAYQYGGLPDSALHYYIKAEPAMLTAYDPALQSGFLMEVGQCYAALNNHDKAIDYFEKTYQLTKADSASATNAFITEKLSDLYAKQNNYPQAFAYAQLHNHYNRQLNHAAAQREVALLAFEREKNKYERDQAEALAAEQRKREAQYVGMSLATVFLFLVLLVFGMFPVSKLVVRMLNFVAFICLFEFIILVIDGWLIEITHHDPLQMWLAKIIIIGILLPLHHALEHVAIKFLTSQKLARFRQHISLKKIFHPSKKQIQKLEENLEQSTLI